mmetsp:Transcript_21471/g.61169  ORF Transcript_21471/g.61169 Transcript_21471/m.61169 type:complete len:268 (-) Transcript_21471:474-1277(-)
MVKVVEDGEVARRIDALARISERKMKNTLKDDAVDVRSVLQDASGGVSGLQFSTVVCDPSLPDEPIVAASQGVASLFGFPMADILGRNCRFMQCEDTDRPTIQRIRRWINEVKASEDKLKVEDLVTKVWNKRSDGTTFWNLLHMSPMMISGKLFLIGVQADLTGSKVDPESHRSEVLTVVQQFFDKVCVPGTREIGQSDDVDVSSPVKVDSSDAPKDTREPFATTQTDHDENGARVKRLRLSEPPTPGAGEGAPSGAANDTDSKPGA